MLRLTVSVLASLFLLSGCSDEAKDGSDGSVSTADAVADTAPGAYGTPCTDNESCASKLCFVEQGADTGVCTETCQQQSDCPEVEGAPYDCGELPGGEIGCYPRSYSTVEFTQGHDCSMDGKCAVGYGCTGLSGDVDRYCAATCQTDRDCPPTYRCAALRTGGEVDPDRWCMRRQFCHPCVIDDQCGGPDDLCVEDDSGNHYCALACTEGSSTCPSHASCEDAGNGSLQCQHSAGACFKSFDGQGDLCDPCIIHSASTIDGHLVTIAEDGACKEENYCTYLERDGGESICVTPCSDQTPCPSEDYACAVFPALDGNFCVPITKDPNTGQISGGSCIP